MTNNKQENEKRHYDKKVIVAEAETTPKEGRKDRKGVRHLEAPGACRKSPVRRFFGVPWRS